MFIYIYIYSSDDVDAVAPMVRMLAARAYVGDLGSFLAPVQN